MGERAYIVTQSIKKLKKDGRQWALDPHGFKRVSDDHPADIAKLSADDKGLYYKDMPFKTSSETHRYLLSKVFSMDSAIFLFINCQRREYKISR